jgi:hypothetical protein
MKFIAAFQLERRSSQGSNAAASDARGLGDEQTILKLQYFGKAGKGRSAEGSPSFVRLQPVLQRLEGRRHRAVILVQAGASFAVLD